MTLFKIKMSLRRNPHNVIHLKQLVRQHSHPIFNLFFLHLLRGRREVEPSRLQSNSRSSVHAARSMLNPRPSASTHIESAALAFSPSTFTPQWQMSSQTLLPPSFYPLGWRPLPTPLTPHLSMGPLCNCRGTLFTFCSASLPRSFSLLIFTPSASSRGRCT